MRFESCAATAALLLYSVGAPAAPVVIQASGTLSNAFGNFSAGNPFSLSVRYDDAAAPVNVSGGVAFFPAPANFSFAVNGVAFHPQVLYYTEFDGRTLTVLTPGDDSLQSLFELSVDRANGAELTLPTTVEVADRAGVFSFAQAGLVPSGGGGGFTTPAAAAIPEPSPTALGLLGVAAMMARRLRRRPRG